MKFTLHALRQISENGTLTIMYRHYAARNFSCTANSIEQAQGILSQKLYAANTQIEKGARSLQMLIKEGNGVVKSVDMIPTDKSIISGEQDSISFTGGFLRLVIDFDTLGYSIKGNKVRGNNYLARSMVKCNDGHKVKNRNFLIAQIDTIKKLVDYHGVNSFDEIVSGFEMFLFLPKTEFKSRLDTHVLS